MNKRQKDVVLDHLNETISQNGNVETISWSAGSVSYNLGMKSTWTKAQQIEINEIKSDIKTLKQDVVVLKQDVVELKADMRDVKQSLNLIIEILARNGMK